MVAAQVLPVQQSKSTAQARNFSQMCGDLALAGVDAYVYYRLASEQSHPSMLVVDQYFDNDKEASSCGSCHVPRSRIPDGCFSLRHRWCGHTWRSTTAMHHAADGTNSVPLPAGCRSSRS